MFELHLRRIEVKILQTAKACYGTQWLSEGKPAALTRSVHVKSEAVNALVAP